MKYTIAAIILYAVKARAICSAVTENVSKRRDYLPYAPEESQKRLPALPGALIDPGVL